MLCGFKTDPYIRKGVEEVKMTHKFKTVNKNKLDNPRRREILPAAEIVKEAGIRKADTIADIGCGIGYFTFLLAEAAGEAGAVYALDIEEEMLADIRRKIGENNTKNVFPMISQEYDLTLSDGSVNTAFLCAVTHEIEKREKFLKEVNRILLPGGKVVIVEWRKEETDYGPPADHRLDKQVLKRNLLRTGFTDIRIMDFNDYFYIATAVSKTDTKR